MLAISWCRTEHSVWRAVVVVQNRAWLATFLKLHSSASIVHPKSATWRLPAWQLDCSAAFAVASLTVILWCTNASMNFYVYHTPIDNCYPVSLRCVRCMVQFALLVDSLALVNLRLPPSGLMECYH